MQQRERNQTFSLVVTCELYKCMYLHITCVFSGRTSPGEGGSVSMLRVQKLPMNFSVTWTVHFVSFATVFKVFFSLIFLFDFFFFFLSSLSPCVIMVIQCMVLLLSLMHVVPVEERNVLLLFAVIQNGIVFFLPNPVSQCYPFLGLNFILSLV